MKLSRPALWILLVALVIAAFSFLLSSSGFKWVYSQWIEPQLAPLRITGLEGNWWGPIQADEVNLFSKSQELTIRKVKIDWSPWSLFSGTVDITELSIETLTQRTIASAPASKSEPVTIQGLPIAITLRQAQIRQLEIKSTEEKGIVISDINIVASSRGEHVAIDTFRGEVDNIKYDVKGTVELNNQLDMNLLAHWNLLQDGREYRANIDVKGNREELLIQHHLKQPVAVSATVILKSWLEELQWQAKVIAEQFDSQLVMADQAIFKGDINLQAAGDLKKGNGTLSIKGLAQDLGEIEMNSELGFNETLFSWEKLSLLTKPDHGKLESQGRLYFKDLKLDANMQWMNVNLVHENKSLLQSKNGTVKLGGHLDQLVWNARFDTSADELPEVSWETEGRYAQKEQKIIVSQLKLNALDGHLQTHGELSLIDKMPWKFSFNGKNINPGKQWKDWNGKLHLKGEASGLIKDQFKANLRLEKLDGKLRDKPVLARVLLDLKADKLLDADVSLRSGNAVLMLKGNYLADADFKWSLNAPTMADLIPGAKGRVKLDGTVTGPVSAPAVKIKGYAHHLSAHDFLINNMQLDIMLPANGEQKGNVNITLKQLEWQQQQWESIQLNAKGSYKQHQIAVEGRQLNQQITTRLNGSWDKQSWRSTLNTLSLRPKEASPWQLSEPAKINVSSRGFTITPACLTSEAESVCFDMDIKTQQTHQGSIQLKQLSLEHFNALLPTHLRMTGKLQGGVHWQLDNKQWQVFHSDIQLSSGAISLPESETTTDVSDLAWRFTGGKLLGNIQNNTLQLSWGLDQDNGKGLSGHLELPVTQWLEKGTAGKLNAGVKANLDDLKIVEAFLPQLYKLKGHIFADLDFAGSLDNPKISGQAGFKNTQMQWPQMGLEIKDMALTFQPEGNHRYSLVANASSDTGNLAAKGQLDWPVENGFKLTTLITGTNFKAVNLPEAQIWITPQLEVDIIPGLVNLNGSVHVPQAKITPKEIKETVSISKDAIVTGLEQAEEPAWQVSSEIRITLGPDISFDGFGLKSQIGGQLTIVDTPHTVTLAQGKLSIRKGSYKAYGQELSIANGDLIYTNNPIDNPALDIRAFRMIEEVQAGVHINGLAQQPQLALYSKPSMSDADILSYLTIGRPLQQLNESEGQQLADTAATSAGLAGGEYLANVISQRLGFNQLEISTETREQQAWVRVGAYLSPRLYLSYGTGLFEEGSSLNLRYKLNKKWTLQGESGDNSSGDLLYTIE